MHQNMISFLSNVSPDVRRDRGRDSFTYIYILHTLLHTHRSLTPAQYYELNIIISFLSCNHRFKKNKSQIVEDMKACSSQNCTDVLDWLLCVDIYI